MRLVLVILLLTALSSCRTHDRVWLGPLSGRCDAFDSDCSETVDSAIQRAITLFKARCARSPSGLRCKASAFDAHCAAGGRVIGFSTGFASWSNSFDAHGTLVGTRHGQDHGPPFIFEYGSSLACKPCQLDDLGAKALIEMGRDPSLITPECPER